MATIRFRFAWPAPLELGVAYRREVRELTTGGSATFGRRWTWRVSRAGGSLVLEPAAVEAEPSTDTRERHPHRPFLDALRDHPRSLRVSADGRFEDVVSPGTFRRAAGISDLVLTGMSPEGRALVEHAASHGGQRAQATDFWESLVGFCRDAGELDDGQVVLTTLPNVPLGPLGVSVPYLLQAEAHREGDAARVRVVSEPDPAALSRAIGGTTPPGAPRIVDYRLKTTTELLTDPATLVPRRLAIDREHAIGVELPDRTTQRQDVIESCGWSFG